MNFEYSKELLVYWHVHHAHTLAEVSMDIRDRIMDIGYSKLPHERAARLKHLHLVRAFVGNKALYVEAIKAIRLEKGAERERNKLADGMQVLREEGGNEELLAKIKEKYLKANQELGSLEGKRYAAVSDYSSSISRDKNLANIHKTECTSCGWSSRGISFKMPKIRKLAVKKVIKKVAKKKVVKKKAVAKKK